jgi:hypothetical protein
MKIQGKFSTDRIRGIGLELSAALVSCTNSKCNYLFYLNDVLHEAKGFSVPWNTVEYRIPSSNADLLSRQKLANLRRSVELRILSFLGFPQYPLHC